MKTACKRMITQQVSEILRIEIEDGDLYPGTKIPTDTELAEMFGVQKQIVRTAIEVLVKEGLLKYISDKEVYVLGHKIERNMEKLEGFTQTIVDRNMKPSFRIVSKYLRMAGNLYGNMFGIKPEDPIFYIKRMCYADGDSISLEELYIPHYLIPKMEGIDLSVFSVYEVYEMYGIHLAEAEQTLDLVRPSLNDAKLLGIDAGTPVMLFQSLTYDTDGRAIEFNRNYVRGDIILSDVRKKSTIPVIIISAKETTQNKIDLLRLGADDYITKPFDMEEVLARIESNLRRVQFQNSQTECLQYNNLTLDLEKNTAFLNGIELSLTAKEFGILELLMKYPDKVFSKSNLFQSVWDTEYIAEDNTLNVHISNLRNKLKAICSDTEFIDTVWGIGYRLHKAKD